MQSGQGGDRVVEEGDENGNAYNDEEEEDDLVQAFLNRLEWGDTPKPEEWGSK